MIRTLIVDDEQPQQEILSSLLRNNFPQFDVLDICSSVDQGVKQVNALQPHLVFLDVVMPPKTGFDLLSELGQINFEVIFTTSFEEYALRAFKVSAVDYLLKPFGLMELTAAIKKLEAKMAPIQHNDHIEMLLENLRSDESQEERIALPTL